MPLPVLAHLIYLGSIVLLPEEVDDQLLLEDIDATSQLVHVAYIVG